MPVVAGYGTAMFGEGVNDLGPYTNSDGFRMRPPVADMHQPNTPRHNGLINLSTLPKQFHGDPAGSLDITLDVRWDSGGGHIWSHGGGITSADGGDRIAALIVGSTGVAKLITHNETAQTCGVDQPLVSGEWY